MKNRLIRDKILAWFSRSELNSVYRELYSNSLAAQKHGLGRIQIWRARSVEKLPVSIDSTATLVNAYVNHQEAVKAGCVYEQDECLRYGYSIALIRFINHITEISQSQKYAQRVHVLAAELGVPEWIVDLRHSGTHGVLPSLTILSVGVKWTLDWLEHRYWIKQIARIRQDEMDIQDDVETELEVKELMDAIRSYQRWMFDEISGVADAESKVSFARVMTSLHKLISDYRSEALTLLSEDGYLTFTEQQLTVLNLDSQRFMNDHHLCMPQKILRFWKPMLVVLHTYHLTPLLLRQLATTITPTCNLRNRLLAGWINFIIVAISKADKPYKKIMWLYRTSCEVPFRSLLETVVTCPSLYTFRLTRLLELSSLEKEKQQKLLPLMKIYSGTKDNNQHYVGQQIKTTADLNFLFEQALHSQSSKDLDVPEIQLPNLDTFCYENKMPWNLCQDAIDWSNCPFGVLPSHKLAYHTLETGDREPMDVTTFDSDPEDIENFDIRDEDLKWTPEQMDDIKREICVL